MAEISRRSLLVGGIAGSAVAVAGAGLLVNEGVLPGRVRAYSLLGLNGTGSPIPDVAPGPRFNGSFISHARGGVPTSWSLTVPPGTVPKGLPLLVCLHGAGANHETAFSTMGVDRFLAKAVAAGTPAFAVASVDGDPKGYWHPHASGLDSSAMVLDELVPLLRKKFSLADSLALYGWSMGGYGALSMVMRGTQVQAAAACSPALFESYADAAAGAFDSQAEFDRYGLRGQGRKYPDIATRIDCGNGDPFYFPVRDFITEMRPQPDGGFEDGAHTYGFMRSVLPKQLAFIGTHLS